MIATLNKSFEEREKALRQNLSSMQTSSKQKIQELNHIVENLRAEIVHKTAESDSLKVQCDNLEKERSSLAVSYPSLSLSYCVVICADDPLSLSLSLSIDNKQSKFESCRTTLENERLSNQENKKKVKHYVDTMNIENKTLQETKANLEVNLKDITAEKMLLEQKHAQLERILKQTQEQVSPTLPSLSLYYMY